ncbi:MAG: hypothetical protein QW767_04910 [Thermoprotei archaeon]
MGFPTVVEVTVVVVEVAAIFVAATHMIAPDHWLPLSAASTRQKFSSRRTLSIAAALGVTHSATSTAVAMLILIVGETIAGLVHYLDTAGFILLLAVAAYFAITGFLERENEAQASAALASAVAVSVFPDFALVPLVLLAAPHGVVYLVQLLILFAAASAASLTAVTATARMGMIESIRKMPPRYSDYAVATVLVVTALALLFT